MSLDKTFCLIQGKIGNIFGPLSQIWDFLEGQKNADHEQIYQTESDIPEDVTEILPHHGHVHRHVRAGIYSLSYCRRRKTLTAIKGDKKKVKDMMSENKDTIQKNTLKRFFGEKFDEKITKHLKLKKKSREFSNIIDNKKQNNSIDNGNNHQPFRRSLLPQQDGGSGRSNFFSHHQYHSRSGNRIGKSKFKCCFLCIPSTSHSNARISKGTSFSKKSIPCKNLPGASFSRESETFCKNLEKLTNKGPAVFNVVHGYKTPFIEHVNYLSRPIFEQHCYYPQERWGQQTSDQVKETEQFCSLC